MQREIEKITNLTERTFLDFVRSDRVAVVVFESKTCPACESLAPVIDRTLRENAETRFGRVNVDEERDLAEKLEISYLPTVMVIREGTLVFRQPGRFTSSELGEIIEHARSVDLEDLRAQLRDE